MKRPLILGFLLWLIASAVLRLAPASLLQPAPTGRILLVYGLSFAFLFLVMRLVTRGLEPGRARRLAIGLFLPTLVLDALASAFFSAAYPNFPPPAAGIFGGWMLLSCGGGLAAVLSGK